MNKALRYTLLAGLMLLLLAFGSCTKPETNTPATSPAVTASPVVVDNPSTGGGTNTDGAETILIPGGTFQMGSADSDALANEDEKPVHAVTLADFHLYTHEVTNEQYAACVAAGACPSVTELESGPTSHTSDPAFARNPVVGVTWNMANAYCTWANGRLPTEAEWEYAARGAESLLYPWGAEAPDCDHTNLFGCQVPADTMPVGSYAPGNSPFGVWDMAGNVWEWTQDWYAEAYYRFSPAESPLGPGVYQDSANPFKVVRGGGLLSDAAQMRSAARLGVNPYRAYNDIGFRCVAEAPLALPANYVETATRFEVTGGDGQNAEDPGVPADSWYDITHSSTTCMDDNGQIHIEITIPATPGTTFALSMEDKPFTCTYDEASDTLKCDGPASSNYEEQHKTIMLLQLFFPNGETLDIDWFNIPIPEECGNVGHLNTGESSVTVSCPVDDTITATFTYDPGITWTEVYLHTLEGTPLPCEVVDEGVMVCTAPDVSKDNIYEFLLQDEGAAHVWSPSTPEPASCPANTGEFVVAYDTPCVAGLYPTFEFFYDPTIHGGFGTVYDGADEQWGITWSPGDTSVTFEDDTPGRITTMKIRFEDDFEVEIPNVVIPACPSAGGTEHGATLEPGCYAPGEEVVFDPAVNIHYLPDDQDVVSASANGTPLTCHPVVDGWTNCSILPGAVGDSVNINYCFADGKCYDGTTTVRACPDSTQSEWSIIGAGCHPVPDPDTVYFMVDTGYDWLTGDSDVTYTATDGIKVYSCITHPSYTGRIYCFGKQPTQPETLKVCLQQPGQPSDCRSFTDFYGWVSGLTCPEPTEAPVVSACSGFSTQSSCQSNGCTWVWDPPAAGPPTGKCK